jgi:hypothetical protein
MSTIDQQPEPRTEDEAPETVEEPEPRTADEATGIPTTQDTLESECGYSERDVSILLQKIDCRKHYRLMKRIVKIFDVSPQDRVARVYAQARIASRTILQDIGADYQSDVPGLVPGMSLLSDAKNPLHTPIVLDTGASLSITPYASDFIEPVTEPAIKNIVGVSDHRSKVEGVGTVRWVIRDVFNRIRTIETQAYLVPSADIRLCKRTKKRIMKRR